MKKIFGWNKLSNWSRLGIVCGGLFSILSAIRYFFLYRDLDRAIVYTLVGFVILGVAYLYGRNLDISHRVDAIEEHLEDMHRK